MEAVPRLRKLVTLRGAAEQRQAGIGLQVVRHIDEVVQLTVQTLTPHIRHTVS